MPYPSVPVAEGKSEGGFTLLMPLAAFFVSVAALPARTISNAGGRRLTLPRANRLLNMRGHNSGSLIDMPAQTHPGTAPEASSTRSLGAAQNTELPLTVKDAARFLGVSAQTVYLWVERKQIPHLRVMGRNIRFLRSDLEPFRAQFKQEVENGKAYISAHK